MWRSNFKGIIPVFSVFGNYARPSLHGCCTAEKKPGLFWLIDSQLLRFGAAFGVTCCTMAEKSVSHTTLGAHGPGFDDLFRDKGDLHLQVLRNARAKGQDARRFRSIVASHHQVEACLAGK